MLIVWWIALVLDLIFWSVLWGLPDIAAGQLPSLSAVLWAIVSCIGLMKLYPLARRYDQMGRS